MHQPLTLKFRKFIYVLLAFLVILDIVLSVTAIFFPATWFMFIHGVEYWDPQGLLMRMGGVWIAFVFVQFIALIKWEKYPWLLVLVAGMRLTEIFSDWVYLHSAQNITMFGRLGLLIAPVSNLAFGFVLVWLYLKMTKEARLN